MSRRLRVRSFALDVSPLIESVPYRSLWLGQLISLMGTNMRIVAISYQIFQLTGSTVAVGLVGLVEVVPLILFSVAGGAIGDRMDRRKLLIRTQSGLILSSGFLAAVSFLDHPPLVALYALTGVIAAITAMDQSTRTAIAPSLVRADQIASISALRQVIFQITQIVGPAIGGLAIVAIGVKGVYLVDALSFVAGLVALRWVPSRPPATDGEQSTLDAIKQGLRFAFNTPVILSIFAIDLVAMIFGMPRAVFPALAQDTFHMGAAGLGLLYAAPSVGALIGALTSGWVGNVNRRGLAVIFSVVVWGAAIALAGLSLFSLALTMVFLAVAGWADVISAVFRGTILIESTPDALRGRLTAVNIMVVTGGPRLGDVEAGLVAGAFGAPASVVIGGVACLVGTAAVAYLFPSMRSYTPPEGPAEEISSADAQNVEPPGGAEGGSS